MKLLIFLIPAIGIGFFSCRTTKILKADFETQTVGSRPLKNLPGDPSGDSCIYSAAVEPLVSIINSTLTMGEKALQMNAGSVPLRSRGLSFKGIATNLQQNIYYILNGDLTTGDLIIDFNDGVSSNLSGVFGRITLNASNGEIRVARTFDELGSGGGVVGTFTPGRFSVIINLNARELKYNLLISSGRNNVTVNDIPTLTTDVLAFANPSKPRISFLKDSGDLKIESIEITRKVPEGM